MSNRTVSAVMLPQGAHTQPEPMLFEAGDYQAIQQVVGGMFDAVRVNVSYGPEQDCVLVGYVNDLGMYDSNCEMNFIASALFQRELRGNVLVVSGTNPENGAYDGDSYDVPEWAWEGIRTDVLTETAEAYNDAMLINFALRFGPKMGIIDQEKSDQLRLRIYKIAEQMERGENPTPLNSEEADLMEYLTSWAQFTITAVKQSREFREFTNTDDFLKIMKEEFGEEES